MKTAFSTHIAKQKYLIIDAHENTRSLPQDYNPNIAQLFRSILIDKYIRKTNTFIYPYDQR